MKAYWDIVQGTEEWHRIRYRKVGGSCSSGLLVDSDTMLDDIGSQFLEEFILSDEGYISSDMQRGIELEPLHRIEIGKYTGHEFLECGWLQSETIPLIGISPDGITKDLRISWEGKSPGAKRHFSTLRQKEIPKDNIYQCIHYFTVNESLEQHYFSSFRPESQYPLFVKELNLDSFVELTVNRKKESAKISTWVERLRGAAIGLDVLIKHELKQMEF